MGVFCITFSLNNNFKKYNEFYTAIKSTGVWWEQHANVWYIASDSNAAYIRDYLSQFIANNDQLFVFEVGSNWAAIGHKQEEYDWIKDVLK